MTIHSHPSEATLLAYAAGTLPTGISLAVAVHLQFCKTCRDPIATWEGVGGTVLESLPESQMAANALARTMARTGETVWEKPPSDEPVQIDGVELPSALSAAGLDKRRWLAPGIWRAMIPAGSRSPAETYLLRLSANRKLPLHGHDGMEAICVMKGSFSDASGRYTAGDFVELDETQLHQPIAGPEGECICIISSDGPPKLRGFLGWLVRVLNGQRSASAP